MKCQVLFSLKNNNANFKMSSATNLLSALRVNHVRTMENQSIRHSTLLFSDPVLNLNVDCDWLMTIRFQCFNKALTVKGIVAASRVHSC